RNVSGLLDHADDVGQTSVRQLLTGRLTGDDLALADVGNRTEVLPRVDTGVDGDDRNSVSHCSLDAGLETVGVGHRDHETVGAVGDCPVDQRALIAGIGRTVVVQVDTEVVARLNSAVLDNVPERVAGVGVGDDVDAKVA